MKANAFPHTRQRGFSMIELLIVVAILMVVAALALPTITSSINVMRLKMTMGSISGVFQECRSVAVRFNRIESVDVSTTAGVLQAKVQPAINPNPNNPDRVMQFPAGMALSTTPPTSLDPNTIWNATNAVAVSTPLSFNPRGLPCSYSSTGCDTGGGNKGFIYYFSYTPAGSTTQWIAVSVSPAGRIKSWYLNPAGGWGD